MKVRVGGIHCVGLGVRGTLCGLSVTLLRLIGLVVRDGTNFCALGLGGLFVVRKGTVVRTLGPFPGVDNGLVVPEIIHPEIKGQENNPCNGNHQCAHSLVHTHEHDAKETT